MYHKNPKHKVLKTPEFKEVVYDEHRWLLLRKLRGIAADLMKVLVQCSYLPILHGSVARGDVDRESDVDIAILHTTSPAIFEACLDRWGLKVYRKIVLRATPTSTMRVIYELSSSGDIAVSIPLEKLNPRETEFYKFGGGISYEELVKDIRVPGVTKSLILVVPTEGGHRAAPVVGYEHYVAKLLGISVDTVTERIRILSRRDDVGRTGLFFKVVLDPSEPVENVVQGKLKRPDRRREA
ncbi:MAG: nucleotidyltransferase domain-containing protein [Sulfolobales archaeon]|nr:nucleotidyltransferase domain-containing protein [Sulfolobales archaeon]MDW8083439.1 nucleotidyltransferase domain-containing protein [Sulfolobales archaeon]